MCQCADPEPYIKTPFPALRLLLVHDFCPIGLNRKLIAGRPSLCRAFCRVRAPSGLGHYDIMFVRYASDCERQTNLLPPKPEPDCITVSVNSFSNGLSDGVPRLVRRRSSDRRETSAIMNLCGSVILATFWNASTLAVLPQGLCNHSDGRGSVSI